MKKCISMAMAGCMALSLAACVGSTPASSTASTTTEATSEAAASTSGSKTDVAFVTDVGNIDDQSFNQYTWQGVQDFCSANSLNANYYRPTEDSDAARLEQMDNAVNDGALTIEKLEAMTCVCSVGLDMIAIPGDTKASTISGIIADELAIGMVNQKTTAVRLIPVIGKGVGETVAFGGLLGYAPIMPVNNFSCEAFVNRTGRIPAPIHSFKN